MNDTIMHLSSFHCFFFLRNDVARDSKDYIISESYQAWINSFQRDCSSWRTRLSKIIAESWKTFMPESLNSSFSGPGIFELGSQQSFSLPTKAYLSFYSTDKRMPQSKPWQLKSWNDEFIKKKKIQGGINWTPQVFVKSDFWKWKG